MTNNQQHSKKQITIMLASGKSIVLTDDISDAAYVKIEKEIESVVNNESADNDKSLEFITKTDRILVHHKHVSLLGLKRKTDHNPDLYKYEIVLQLDNSKTIVFSNKEVDADLKHYEKIIDQCMKSFDPPNFLILRSSDETLFINTSKLYASVIRQRNVNHKASI